jgi:mycothiol synthase
MAPHARPYGGDDDAWRIRAFLRESFRLDGRRARVWPVARFDYARAHTCPSVGGVSLEEVATVWDDGGAVVALLMPDGGPGEAHLSVHPHHRTPAFDAAMLDVAEERLSVPAGDSRRSLLVWAHDHDASRVAELERRGFERTGGAELSWRRDLSRALEAAPVAEGYSLRSLEHGLDLLERCFASGLAFHDGDAAVALANRADIGWYERIQAAPLYRRDLDVVAVAPDAAIAAFCTVWFDDATRSAMVEPLGVVPAHRRKGLARAVLTDGLRRVQRLGADLAFVGGHSEAANALYGSVLSDGCERYELWLRRW